MRVLSIVGNRPQFIKSAPLSLALREAGDLEFVLHTGQHYDHALSQIFFDELGLGATDYMLGHRTSDVAVMAPVVSSSVSVVVPPRISGTTPPVPAFSGRTTALPPLNARLSR